MGKFAKVSGSAVILPARRAQGEILSHSGVPGKSGPVEPGDFEPGLAENDRL